MRLQGKKIATLVAEGVEDLEYYVPLMRLQEEGTQVLTAGLDLKPVHGKNGLEIKPDISIDALAQEDLFGLILPGGCAPDKLRRYSAVKDLVRRMYSEGKIIGIICHGGLVAISAGIIRGRATGSLGIKDDIVNAGGTRWRVVRAPDPSSTVCRLPAPSASLLVSMPVLSGAPVVTLRHASARAYDAAIAAARTCYAPRVIGAEEVTPSQRETIGQLTFEAGHTRCTSTRTSSSGSRT